MTNETKLQNDFKEKLEAIKHPNISIEIYPPGKRLSDFERAEIIYPLTPSHFVLFKMDINNGVSIFTESSNYLFIYNHIFISSSMGLEYWDRSDGALDATGSSCKLLYEKIGLKGFELIINKETKTQQLALNLKDGNSFLSVGFKPKEKVPANFVILLNQALIINKWL